MPTRRYYSNTAPQLTLASSITNSATSLSIAGSFTGWPVQFPYFATIDLGTASAEVISVTAVSGTTATIVRGQDGTTGISHAAGATLDQTVVAKDLDEANAHTSANTGVHGISGSVVGTTDTQTLTNKTLTNPVISGASFTTTVTLPNAIHTGDATHPALVGRATTAGGKTLSLQNSSSVEKLSADDAGNLTASATVSAGAVAATGAVSGASVAATGAVTGASSTLTGALNAASAAITGNVGAATVAATGAVTGASFAASGNGTVSGVVEPKVFATTAARDAAITSPVAGMVVFVTANNRLYFYDGGASAWYVVGQAPPVWSTLTLTVGSASAGNYVPAAVLHSSGKVELRGVIAAGTTFTSGTVIFTLPAQFRPTSTVLITPGTNFGSSITINSELQIAPSGDATLFCVNAAVSALSLDNLSFYTS